MRLSLLNLACVAILFGGMSTAHAQIEKNQGTGFAGLLAGYADPTNVDGRFGYGAQVGMIFPNGVTGLLYLMNSVASQNSADITLMHYGAGLDYSLSGVLSGPLGGLHAGVRAGMVSYKVEGAGASVTDDSFSYGPALGYDHAITAAFSLGGEADLMISSDSDLQNTLYLLATGKFWF